MSAINNEVSQRLSNVFPDHLTQQSQPSEIEKKVEACVNSVVIKACDFWEGINTTTKNAKNIYKAVWLPYYILKHPFAYKNQLHSNSPEKNLEILSNATARNVNQSVVTPEIARSMPHFSFSSETGLSVSKYLSGTALLFPLVYGPAYRTLWTVYSGNGLKNWDPTQIFHDIGQGLQKSASLYQGPEAIVSAITAAALGILMGTVSFSLWYLLLTDGGGKERYKALDKLYTDAMMTLKNRWDEAEKSENSEEMKQCVLQATKLQANVKLISSNLTRIASLTDTQSKDIKAKLSWGPSYVLSQHKLLQEKENKVAEEKTVVE
jgi:hypothetical protein